MDLSKPLSKQNHPARRRLDSTPAEEQNQLAAVQARMDAFETKLDANTELTRRSVDMFEGLEAGIKALGAFSTFAKWLAPIIACGAAIYALATGKTPMDQ